MLGRPFSGASVWPVSRGQHDIMRGKFNSHEAGGRKSVFPT